MNALTEYHTSRCAPPLIAAPRLHVAALAGVLRAGVGRAPQRHLDLETRFFQRRSHGIELQKAEIERNLLVPPLVQVQHLVVLHGTQVLRRLVRHEFDGAAALFGGGVAGAVLFVATAGPCITGPFAALDPLLYRFWYLDVMEGQPIWRQGSDMWGILLLHLHPTALSLLGGAIIFAAVVGKALWDTTHGQRNEYPAAPDVPLL